MRVATIDVGTNTVRLLVADVVGPASWTVVDQRQTVTRLGEGLAAAGALGEAPMARTLAVVGDYVARDERRAGGGERGRVRRRRTPRDGPACRGGEWGGGSAARAPGRAVRPPGPRRAPGHLRHRRRL